MRRALVVVVPSDDRPPVLCPVADATAEEVLVIHGGVEGRGGTWMRIRRSDGAVVGWPGWEGWRCAADLRRLRVRVTF